MSWCCISWKIQKEINQNDQIFITVCVCLVMTRWRHATRSDQPHPSHRACSGALVFPQQSSGANIVTIPKVDIVTRWYWYLESSVRCVINVQNICFLSPHSLWSDMISSEWSPLPSSSSDNTANWLSDGDEWDDVPGLVRKTSDQQQNKIASEEMWNICWPSLKVWQFTCLML